MCALNHTFDAGTAAASASSDSRRGCWNRIGIQGDRSCPELKRIFHCWDCPVFSSGAAALLERPAPPGYLADWTLALATSRQDSESGRQMVLVFRVGHELLAMPARYCREVASQRPVQALPHRRSRAVLGIVNVNGNLLVAVSLSRLSGITSTEEKSACQRLLVVEKDAAPLALPVDEVLGFARCESEASTKEAGSGAGLPCLAAVVRWKEKAAALLDMDKLFVEIEKGLR